jgi:hypothetical protein
VVAEAKAGGLASAGASESGARQPGGNGWAGGGRGIRVSVRRVAGAQVRSSGGGHASRGGTDLSRVRDRGAGARGIFLDKAITFVGHP